MVSLVTYVAGAGLGGNAVFGDLQPGDRFAFPKHPHVLYVKAKGGWYFRLNLSHPDLRGRGYRTGSGTAVVRQEASRG